MPEKKGSPETRELLKALLSKYPDRPAAAVKSGYSISYLSYLSTGHRIASKSFCDWVKAAHPELRHLCTAVQLSKVMD
jgi:hypothetical protein